jgi:hypothetical protein
MNGLVVNFGRHMYCYKEFVLSLIMEYLVMKQNVQKFCIYLQ